ncbi:MAG: sigma factor-like helix-turn-helix DNA-binding protein [Thermomicrobiales bacterium]
MKRATCKVDGCEGVAIGHGWCALHYQRWRTHGDPLETLRPDTTRPDGMTLRLARPDGFREALQALRPRQREVLALRCQGLTNQQTAERLHAAETTVRVLTSETVKTLGAVTEGPQEQPYSTLAGICWRIGYEMALMDVRRDEMAP